MDPTPASFYAGEHVKFYTQHIKIFPAINSGDITSSLNLVCSSSKYGLICAAQGRLIKVFQSKRLYCDEDSSSLVEIQTPGDIVHISFNSDELMLLAVLDISGDLHGYLYDARNFIQGGEPKSFCSTPLSMHSKSKLQSIAWNPTDPNCVAVILSTGHLSILTLNEKSIIFNTKDLKACCAGWSAKGKQLAVGLMNGSIALFKPDLTPVRSIMTPPIENCGAPMDITWFTNFEFFVCYLVGKTQPCLCYVKAPKTGNPSFVNFDDICFTHEENKLKPISYYSKYIPEWNVLMSLSSHGTDLGLLGKGSDGNSWCQWTVDEDARAEMVYIDLEKETFPLGLTFDLTSAKTFRLLDSGENGPYPVIVTLSTGGELNFFHFGNELPNIPKLSVVPSPLPTSGHRHAQQYGHNPAVQYPSATQTPSVSTTSNPPVNVPQFSSGIGKTQSSGISIPTPQTTPQSSKSQPFSQFLTPGVSQQGGSLSGSGKIAALPLGSPGQPSFHPQGVTGQVSFHPQGVSGQTGSQSGNSVPGSLQPQNPTGKISGQPQGVFGQSSQGSFQPQTISGQISVQPQGASGYFGIQHTDSKTGLLPVPKQSPIVQTAPKSPLLVQQLSSPSSKTPLSMIQGQLQVATSPLKTALLQPTNQPSPAASSNVQTIQKTPVTPKSDAVTLEQKKIQEKLIKDTMMKHIAEEFSQFSLEVVNELKKNSSSMVKIGTDKDAAAAMQFKSKSLEWITEMTKTTTEQGSEISQLHQNTMDANAFLEDVKNHAQSKKSVRTQAYLQHRPLDPYTRRKLNDIRSRFYYIRTQISNAQAKLDLEWQNYNTQLKEKRKLRVDNTEVVYRSVMNLYNARLAAEQNINNLCQKMKDLNPKHCILSADSFLESKNEVKSLKQAFDTCKITAQPSPSSICSKSSPQKMTALQKVLLNRTTTPVRTYSTPKKAFDTSMLKLPKNESTLRSSAVPVLDYEDISPVESPVKGVNPLQALTSLVGNKVQASFKTSTPEGTTLPSEKSAFSGSQYGYIQSANIAASPNAYANFMGTPIVMKTAEQKQTPISQSSNTAVSITLVTSSNAAPITTLSNKPPSFGASSGGFKPPVSSSALPAFGLPSTPTTSASTKFDFSHSQNAPTGPFAVTVTQQAAPSSSSLFAPKTQAPPMTTSSILNLPSAPKTAPTFGGTSTSLGTSMSLSSPKPVVPGTVASTSVSATTQSQPPAISTSSSTFFKTSESSSSTGSGTPVSKSMFAAIPSSQESIFKSISALSTPSTSIQQPASGTDVSKVSANTTLTNPNAQKSLFSQSTAVPTTTTASAFGSASIFGQTTFDKKSPFAAVTSASADSTSLPPKTTSAATTSSLFAAPSTSTFGSTSGPSSSFPTTTTTSSGSLFGGAPKPISTSTNVPVSGSGSIFGSTAFGSASASASPFGAPSTTNAFGSQTSGNSLFGGKTSFGGNAAASTGSVFGGISNPASSTNTGTTSNSSTFGSVTITPTGTPSVFGNTGNQGSTFGTSSLFGGQAAQVPTKSPFGDSKPSAFGGAPTPTSQSIFGATSQAAPASFGGGKSSFGGFAAASTQTSSSTSSVFGSMSTATSTGTSAFGNAPSVFGNQTQGAAKPFGTPQSPTTGGFGSSAFANVSICSGLGGTPSSDKSAKNVFGSSGPSTPASTDLFKPKVTQSAFGSPTTSSAFGSLSPFSANKPQSAFGAPAAFGGSPAFGGKPVFGSPPAFAGSPSFGSNSASTGFSAFGGSQSGSTFGSTSAFGNQTGTASFSNLSQQSGSNAPEKKIGEGSAFSAWRS